jgi:hypothetical protein
MLIILCNYVLILFYFLNERGRTDDWASIIKYAFKAGSWKLEAQILFYQKRVLGGLLKQSQRRCSWQSFYD